MDLNTWFKEEAGLQGQRLDVAVASCEKGEISTPDELRQLLELGQLAQVFSNALTRGMVNAALSRESKVQGSVPKDNIKRKDKTRSNDNLTSKQQTRQVQQTSAVELPADKFHYFCSHKVRFDHSLLLL